MQPPWAARQAKPAAPVNAAAPAGTRTAPETENPGWLDLLPKLPTRDQDPDVASWWFPFLLLGIGTAMLHPLAASGESMCALGYASIFGAASLTAKAAASATRRSAQWIARKGTDFIYRDATPEL